MFWVRSDLESGKKISFQFLEVGVFWVRSYLESGKKIRVFHFWGGGGGGVLGKVRFGGVLGKVRLGLWEEFHVRGGGVFWNQVPEQGCSGEFGQKFLET